MKKLVGIISVMFTMMTVSWGQCTVTATSSSPSVLCGQCVTLNAVGQVGTPVMDNNFNGGNLGAGWVATGGSTVGVPCGPSIDGTSYYWASTATGTPQLTTAGLDVSCGGSVSFDMVYSAQGGAAPCEGPDLPNEGVTFQYSIDGGVTWVDIQYWDPLGGNNPTLTSWNTYSFIIPPAAMTTGTQFQWIQQNSSGACCDNWGLDNVQILANDCGYYYDWVHLPGSPDQASGGSVCPTTTTTYDVIYTDGIGDTCTSSITINISIPTVTATATPATLGCGDCTTLEAVLSNLPPDTCCYTLVMDDSFGDGWNGGFLTISVVGVGNLGPFSAQGNGSVATFCVVDGTTFSMSYTSGSWESENTYTLQDPNGVTIFNDGPNPTTGNVFTTIAGCGSVPIVWAFTWTGQNISNPNNSITQACPTMGGLYTVEVYDPNNPLCSVIDGVNITIPSGLDTTIYETVYNCGDIDYTFPDGSVQNITQTTTYISNLLTPSGCDSIVETTVVIYPEYSVTETVDVCSNTPYTFPDGTTQNITNNTSYVSSLLTQEGCDSIITTNVNVYQLPPFDISFSPNECPPAVMAITNNTPGTDCQWGIFGPSSQNQYGGCDMVTDLFEISGQYTVTLNMVSPDGCPMDTVITNAFELYPVPLASFTSTPNNGSVVTNNNIVFNNSSIGGTTHNWDFGDGDFSNGYNVSHTYDTPGNYEVILYVSNDYGCSDTIYGYVMMNPELTMYVPNTFTPDGDEFNNTFKPIIQGNDIYDFHMKIYNRWGEIVFKTNDQGIGWDGSYGGKSVQDGTFVWEIHLVVESGTEALPKQFYGHVNVFR